MSFSLYIHIPWCQSKCPYCDFNSHAAASWPEDNYVRALIGELQRRADEAPWKGLRVRTIFFGGGTPSLFAAGSIGRLIEAADRICGIEQDAEITLEANPGTADPGKLRMMRSVGVNRLSFGAQSFKPELLRFLGRIHSADETRAAVENAKTAGFERVNLDLIFAVPGQSLDDLMTDIEIAVALAPDHVSAYNLTFEQGTAFFTGLRSGRIKALDDDMQAGMYSVVRSELPARGYPMYEISNYASAGHEAQHNLNYWKAESYLGLGAGAHSFARSESGGRRWWNERGPQLYMTRMLGRGGAEAGFEVVDGRIAAGEFVFLNLRLREGFSRLAFARRFGATFDSVFGPVAAPLFEHKLLVEAGGRVRLSERGLEMADSVFAEFV